MYFPSRDGFHVLRNEISTCSSVSTITLKLSPLMLYRYNQMIHQTHFKVHVLLMLKNVKGKCIEDIHIKYSLASRFIPVQVPVPIHSHKNLTSPYKPSNMSHTYPLLVSLLRTSSTLSTPLYFMPVMIPPGFESVTWRIPLSITT